MFLGTDIRNNFENDDFDWFSFHKSGRQEHLKGGRKAIAVPMRLSFQNQAHKRRGLAISGPVVPQIRTLNKYGIGVIDVDDHKCMTLGSVQTPDNATLESYGKNLVTVFTLSHTQEHLKRISRRLSDVIRSKATFIKPLCENGFHVIRPLPEMMQCCFIPP